MLRPKHPIKPSWGQELFAALTVSVLIALANALFCFPINQFLTWGTPVIALTFGVNELTHSKLGTEATARAISMGVFGGLVATLLVAPGQIALASAAAFSSAHLGDIYLFRRLRNHAWWMAPFFASAAATLFDTTLFFTIAFWRNWQSAGPLLLGDFSAKLAVDCLMLVPFRLATRSHAKVCLTGPFRVANDPMT